MESMDYLSRARTFTECPRGSDHELDHPYVGAHHNVPHYGQMGVTYIPANLQYSPAATAYSTFAPSYNSSSNHAQPVVYMSNGSNPSIGYQLRPPPRSATLPSQPKVLSSTPYYPPHPHNQHLQLRNNLSPEIVETEEQQSVNCDTMRSEPLEPALEGYPNVNEFEKLMKHYVEQLSPKKQDKALIHAKRAANIKTVLLDKKTTSVESAQFRFWVKKMFELFPQDSSVHPGKKKICHEGKPVAVREKLFKILTRAHQKCQHGGRDKTSAQVRRVYSWVPKELISRFVKICPTCQIRRGLKGGSPPNDGRSPTDFADPLSPQPSSPSRAGDESSSLSRGMTELPMQLVTGSSAFQSQNRWLSGFQPQTGTYDYLVSARSSSTPKLPSNKVSSVGDMDQITLSRTTLSHLHNGQSGGSSLSAGHKLNVEQETHYCYE